MSQIEEHFRKWGLQEGDLFQHYKGGQYSVGGFVLGAEDTELVERVLYTCLETGKVFSRPITNFFEDVPGKGPRFVRI